MLQFGLDFAQVGDTCHFCNVYLLQIYRENIKKQKGKIIYKDPDFDIR
jgi:hypothetical protein